jgi:hypothetical protein
MRYRSFLVGAVVVVMTTPGLAQIEPTVTDIAACNEEAAGKTGHPGALPAPRPGPGSIGRMPGTREGTTDPTGSIVTQSPDPLLKGMDAARVSDPAYRTAYRDCMQARMRGR